MAVDATSPAGATPSFSASASDGADPSPTLTCSPGSGSVLPIGKSTITCTATDHVGNAAAGSFTVTVRGAKEQLTRLIEDVINASKLSHAVKARLVANLRPLVAAFDPSRPAQRNATCRRLNAFTAVLRLLSGRGIPTTQAMAWIGDANRIKAVIGC